VSLDSIVYDYLSGLSPESIADNFDSLSLEQVYGAITFYLSHRDEVDRHLMSNRAKFDALRKKAENLIRCSTASWKRCKRPALENPLAKRQDVPTAHPEQLLQSLLF
jgi:hypothetical protein